MQLDPAPLLLDGAWVPGPELQLEVRDPRDDALVGRIPVAGAAEVDAAVAGAVKAAAALGAHQPGGAAPACSRRRARALREAADEIAELCAREGGKPLGDAAAASTPASGRSSSTPSSARCTAAGRCRALGRDRPDALGAARRRRRAHPLERPGRHRAAGPRARRSPRATRSSSSRASARRCAAHAWPRCSPSSCRRACCRCCTATAAPGAPLAAHPDVDVVYHVGSSVTGAEIRQGHRRHGRARRARGRRQGPVRRRRRRRPGLGRRAGRPRRVRQRRADLRERRAGVRPRRRRRRLPGRARRAGRLASRSARSSTGVSATSSTPHVTEAVESGATVLAGGAVPEGAGAWYPPTVLVGCTDDMAVMQEETFGPVAAVRVVARSTRRSPPRPGRRTGWRRRS